MRLDERAGQRPDLRQDDPGRRRRSGVGTNGRRRPAYESRHLLRVLARGRAVAGVRPGRRRGRPRLLPGAPERRPRLSGYRPSWPIGRRQRPSRWRWCRQVTVRLETGARNHQSSRRRSHRTHFRPPGAFTPASSRRSQPTGSITPLWDRRSAGGDGRSGARSCVCVGKGRPIGRAGGPASGEGRVLTSAVGDGLADRRQGPVRWR
jgi:hypothetical protein